jgi:exopolysaccharide production protein ExoQ
MSLPAPPPRHPLLDLLTETVDSPRFGRVITLTIVATACSPFLLRSLIGWAGLIAIIGTLVLLAAFSLVRRRHEVEWHGLLPLSLLLLVVWSMLSVFWSEYRWETAESAAYQAAFAFLAVYVAMTRDFIQIVRAFGDVLRTLLLASLAIEVLSGVLLDTPFGFLGIGGMLPAGGPVQGIFGTRNLLGFVSLVALATFYIEVQTRSVSRRLALASAGLAGAMILLTRSPVTIGTAAIAMLGAVALIALRRMDRDLRQVRQLWLLGGVAGVVLVGLLARRPVIELINAGSEFEYRLRLWRSVRLFTGINPIEGYGWAGYWRRDLLPFSLIDIFSPPHASALSAYLDVWLQLGVVGFLALIAVLALTFVRSWRLASNRRSIIFVWPAIVVLILIVVSTAESFALVEFGWFTLVVCAVRASQELSWRRMTGGDPV